MENIFVEYAEIQQKIKELDERRRVVSGECLTKMQELEQNSFKNELGTYTITKRKFYSYSPAVKIKEIEIKNLKRREEQTGEAEHTISEGIMFRGKSIESQE